MSDTPLHIYFLLDRSGSMESIAGDVVGGYNSFLSDQKASGADALMTFIQFDSQNPHEVLGDARPVREMKRLSSRTFQPRGGTPLYDAMGDAIVDATIRADRRRAAGEPPEEIMFVTFTDGMENQSREYDRKMIFNLITKRTEAGWTFVYLGANQDAYASGDAMGISAGNTQNFAADSAGSRAAFASLSGSVTSRRERMRSREAYDTTDLFEGSKGAEEDLEARRS